MRSRILIGILSAHNYQSRRDTCRATWVGVLRQHRDATAVFLIGAGEAVARPVLIDDVLLLPCPDAYESLPQRTRWFCRWALAHDDHWDYLFKCDDDTYVCVERLLGYNLAGKDYVGAEWMPGVNYASGGAGYFLSRRAAAVVAEQLTAGAGAEDLAVGKILQAAGFTMARDDRFVAYGAERPRPDPDNDLITTHAVGVDTFHQMHREFTSRWRFRIVMPTSNAYANRVVPATLILLSEFWPDHPPIDLLHYDVAPQEHSRATRYRLGRQSEVPWTDGLASYLALYHDEELLLLMLDDYALCGPPRRDAIYQAQNAMLADPQIGNVHLAWQAANPKSAYALASTGIERGEEPVDRSRPALLRLPTWAYSVNTQAALWRRSLLLKALRTHPATNIEAFELAASQWFNQTQNHSSAHCQVSMPEPPRPSGYLDETDKTHWALPYHNLMHRGDVCERHSEFLVGHGLEI